MSDQASNDERLERELYDSVNKRNAEMYAEIERLTRELAEHKGYSPIIAAAERSMLQAERDRLRAALEWYVDQHGTTAMAQEALKGAGWGEALWGSDHE